MCLLNQRNVWISVVKNKLVNTENVGFFGVTCQVCEININGDL